MNTSEQRKLHSRAVDDSMFSFLRMHLREEDMREIRMDLYHSSGEGYYIFRGFIPPDLVTHMRAIWCRTDQPPSFRMFPGNQGFYIGCPNYFVRYDDGSAVFYNFLFAPPLDEVTLEVSIAINALRNRLSGRSASDGLHGGRALNYRVTRNLNRTSWAPAHTDWMDYERRWEKGQYDPSRLQATLLLSEKGSDYSGTGFRFSTNAGRSIAFGTDVPVSPGDLVIWRYGNLHSVEDVATTPGQLGFLRLIFPIYNVPAEKPPEARAAEPFKSKLVRHGTAVAKGIARRIVERLS